MKKLAARDKRKKLVELIRQSGNPDAIALKMTTAKRATDDARALITRLLRGWNVGEKEIRAIDDAVRHYRSTTIRPDGQVRTRSH